MYSTTSDSQTTLGIILSVLFLGILIKNYIKSPTQQDKDRLGFALVLAVILAGWTYLMKGNWDGIEQVNLDKILIWMLLLAVIVYFITSCIFMLSTTHKGDGFYNLNKILDDGLKGALRIGLISGAFFGALFETIDMTILGMTGGILLGMTGGILFDYADGPKINLPSCKD